MNVGDVVYNQYHGIDRFGIIAKTRLDEHGWKHCIVDWIDDDKYEYAISWREQLVGVNHGITEYRCTQLKLIDVEDWMGLLKKIKKAQKKAKK